MESVFQEIDTGYERISLNAITVEVIGVTVGSGDKNNTVGH